MKYRITEKCPKDCKEWTEWLTKSDRDNSKALKMGIAAGWIEEIEDPLEECKRSFYALAHQLGLYVFDYESLWHIVERDWKYREKELYTIDEVMEAIRKTRESRGYADLARIKDELKNLKK